MKRKIWNVSLKSLWILLSFAVCFLLVWCKSDDYSSNEMNIKVGDFSLKYAGNVKLEKIWINADDLSEVIDLYQEVWDNVGYRDSLLIAEKYSQWLWINTFVQDNLEILEIQGLTLANINKKQIWIKKDGENNNAVLLEYEIIEWFVPEIPLLYVSQLFVPNWENIVLMSFLSENKSSRNVVSKMFKDIKIIK